MAVLQARRMCYEFSVYEVNKLKNGGQQNEIVELFLSGESQNSESVGKS